MTKEKQDQQLKVVIRHLPPDIPPSVFWNSAEAVLGQLPNQPAYDWKQFYPGKISKTRGKENRFSRAYIHFKTLDHLVAFHRDYQGHLFQDSKGNVARALVEFAPYQRIALPKKPDPRQGSIEKAIWSLEAEYVAFLEQLKNPQPASLVEPTAGLSEPPSTITPLIEHLQHGRSGKGQQSAHKKKGKEGKKATEAAKPKALMSRNEATATSDKHAAEASAQGTSQGQSKSNGKGRTDRQASRSKNQEKSSNKKNAENKQSTANKTAASTSQENVDKQGPKPRGPKPKDVKSRDCGDKKQPEPAQKSGPPKNNRPAQTTAPTTGTASPQQQAASTKPSQTKTTASKPTGASNDEAERERKRIDTKNRLFGAALGNPKRARPS